MGANASLYARPSNARVYVVDVHKRREAIHSATRRSAQCDVANVSEFVRDWRRHETLWMTIAIAATQQIPINTAPAQPLATPPRFRKIQFKAANTAIGNAKAMARNTRDSSEKFISPPLNCALYPSTQPIQRTFGSLRSTGGGTVFACPTMIGATDTQTAGRPSVFLPPKVFRKLCANPIQQVPNPLA